MARSSATTIVEGMITDASQVEEYLHLEHIFDTVSSDVHLPFLEVQLYKKYFVCRETIQNQQKFLHFKEIVETLVKHKAQTVTLLSLCRDRDRIVAGIQERANSYANNRLTTLEVQSQVLQLLHDHQDVTWRLVEGVVHWRELLSRPYPFQVKGINCFFNILEDCKKMDAELHAVLPLRLSQFPLSSNVSALGLFHTNDVQFQERSKTAYKRLEKDDGAQKEKRRVDAAILHKVISGESKSNDRRQRLRAAERTLFSEGAVQNKLVRELHSIAQSGRFVTILNIHQMIPNCGTGVPIANKEWNDQWSYVMEKERNKLELRGQSGEVEGTKV